MEHFLLLLLLLKFPLLHLFSISKKLDQNSFNDNIEDESIELKFFKKYNIIIINLFVIYSSIYLSFIYRFICHLFVDLFVIYHSIYLSFTIQFICHLSFKLYDYDEYLTNVESDQIFVDFAKHDMNPDKTSDIEELSEKLYNDNENVDASLTFDNADKKISSIQEEIKLGDTST